MRYWDRLNILFTRGKLNELKIMELGQGLEDFGIPTPWLDFNFYIFFYVQGRYAMWNLAYCQTLEEMSDFTLKQLGEQYWGEYANSTKYCRELCPVLGMKKECRVLQETLILLNS